MPTAPSVRMQAMASRWLTDTVTLTEPVFVSDARPLGKVTAVIPETLLTDDLGNPLLTDEGEPLLVDDDPLIVTYRALVRADAGLVDDQNVRRNVRDLKVWIDDDGTAQAGQRLTVTSCHDATLVDVYGQVVTVERDALRAVRRLTVRVGNHV